MISECVSTDALVSYFISWPDYTTRTLSAYYQENIYTGTCIHTRIYSWVRVVENKWNENAERAVEWAEGPLLIISRPLRYWYAFNCSRLEKRPERGIGTQTVLLQFAYTTRSPSNDTCFSPGSLTHSLTHTHSPNPTLTFWISRSLVRLFYQV